MQYQNFSCTFFRFVTKHARIRQTDRLMGQNYDPQDRASIAASRGKRSGLHQWILLHIRVIQPEGVYSNQ